MLSSIRLLNYFPILVIVMLSANKHVTFRIVARQHSMGLSRYHLTHFSPSPLVLSDTVTGTTDDATV